MRILTIILLFCGFGAFAQPIVYQGNANSITGFKGGVLADSGYYHPNIKGADTVLPGISTTGNGKEFSFTRTIFNRWVQTQISGSIPTLQQVLISGNIITTQSEIQLQQSLNFTGASNLIVTAPMLKTTTPIAYSADFSYGNLDVPTYGAVKNLVSQSSFDTTISTTVTNLTSMRFSLPVKYIICDCGIIYNSAWFSQAGTTITFLNSLKFYNGYKLTIAF